MHSLSYRLAAQQLREIDSDVRLVVIHPNYGHQHLILSELLDEDHFAYIRLDGKSLSRSEVDHQLQQALVEQLGDSSLANLRYLVLDECDCMADDGLGSFVTDTLAKLDGGRLVMVTRQPPAAVVESESLRSQTAFIPVDESLMLWDYARRTTERPHLLEVRALGTGRVLLNGRSVDSWDGVLPRSLFFYLVDKGMTTRNDIFETFWPNLSVREATNVFHVTKRKISEVLGVDLTIYWSGFYRISPDIELSYDVVQFSELLQSSVIEPAESAASMLRRAVSLYRDDFLMALNADWVENRRRELRQSYSEALIGLAKAVEEQGNFDEALGLYLRALKMNPQREDVAHTIMQVYQDSGYHADAMAVYRRLEDELQRNLGVSPARHLRELAQELERISVSND